MSNMNNMPTEEVSTEQIHEDLEHLTIAVEPESVSYGTTKLGNLPPRINLNIFNFVDQCTSVCLGLTCKKFWTIHSANHPKTNLFACTWVWTGPTWPRWQKKIHLFHLLKEWMGNTLTEDEIWLHEEVVRLIKEISENADTWNKFDYPDPELMDRVAAIVLGGWDRWSGN